MNNDEIEYQKVKAIYTEFKTKLFALKKQQDAVISELGRTLEQQKIEEIKKHLS